MRRGRLWNAQSLDMTMISTVLRARHERAGMYDEARVRSISSFWTDLCTISDCSIHVAVVALGTYCE